MKRIAIIFAALAAFACVSCNKEENPAAEGGKTLIAYADTKTVLNSDWTVSWAENDNLLVYTAATGTTAFSKALYNYSSDNEFVISTESTAPEAVATDWYVCYPYMQYAAAPNATKGYTVALTSAQAGYGSAVHTAVNDILAGKAFAVAAETTPVVQLHHVCTMFKFTVVNNATEATKINAIELDATAGGSYIAGSFTMNYGAEGVLPSLDANQMGSSKSYKCTVTVTDPAELQAGGSADIYMVTAPFTIPADGVLKITVKSDLGDLLIEKKMTSAITFAAGEYNTATLSYTKPEYVVFTETFGANTVAYASVASYGKAGLTTAVPEHKANYTYAAAGNTSFAMMTGNNGGINNANWIQYLDGAAVKFPATSATATNSSIAIKGITIEANTSYIFKYNKSKGLKDGADFDTKTAFKIRKNGDAAWTLVDETAAAGEIAVEFTTGDYTVMDIMVEATDRNPASPTKYPAVDLFRLIRK